MNTLTIWPSSATRTRQQPCPFKSLQDLAFVTADLPSAAQGGKRTARRCRRSSLAESILASRQMAESA